MTFQPPWDLETRKKYILHYTYGCDYNMKVKSFLCPELHSCDLQTFVINLPSVNRYLNLSNLLCFLLCYGTLLWQIYFCLTSVFHDSQGELTYGKIGEWRFDKRSHLRGPPPKNLPLPPPGVPESVVCVCRTCLLI